MAKKNAFLAKLEEQAAKKQSVKTEHHIEFDAMALLFSANDKLHVGPGRASDLLDSWDDYKIKIASEIMKEIREDQSKKKEILVARRNFAVRLKEILGRDGWEKHKYRFEFVRDYWEW